MTVSLEDAALSEKYMFIGRIIKRFSYQKLARKEKHIVISYLHKVTGYKKGRLYQFIKRAEKGKLQKAIYVRSNPVKIYVTKDIKLLETTDELHLRLSEDATKKILERNMRYLERRNTRPLPVFPIPILPTSGIAQFTNLPG